VVIAISHNKRKKQVDFKHESLEEGCSAISTNHLRREPTSSCSPKSNAFADHPEISTSRVMQYLLNTVIVGAEVYQKRERLPSVTSNAEVTSVATK